MQTGTSVVVFLIIGAVVMALFCLITRYFNKKLQKALEDENEVYSMIDEIRGKQGDEENGDYDQFQDKRQNDLANKDKKANPFELEMSDMKNPLSGFRDDIYGKGRLKRRLDGELQSAPLNPETNRSTTSMRSFKPDRLDSKRNSTKRSALMGTDRINQSQDEEGKDAENEKDQNGENKGKKGGKRRTKKQKKRNEITKHKYTSKIVGYNEEGISILEKHLISIIKVDEINEKKIIKTTIIKEHQNSFEDTLEAYGFEKGNYAACKIDITLEIPHMKPSEEYPVASLKSSEAKEEIEFAEFFRLKNDFELED